MSYQWIWFAGLFRKPVKFKNFHRSLHCLVEYSFLSASWGETGKTKFDVKTVNTNTGSKKSNKNKYSSMC